ncbi:hypothetical protein PVT25_15895 [Paenarthrobacter ureafaciens]|uniref:hypothetical protein n=1 Tax=Paenarthrobacter ureafaciens TaxID=37931 RepID=UPI0029309C94|nr:hypothetical protein [Paenarthrobacter ureafaciens]WNZ03113.1 hypothetical protein PVT25_15895 [Paenarthrobacter ureafaciens]
MNPPVVDPPVVNPPVVDPPVDTPPTTGGPSTGVPGTEGPSTGGGSTGGVDTVITTPGSDTGISGATAGLNDTMVGTVTVASASTEGAMGAGSTAAVVSSAGLAATGLNQSFILWAVGLALLGLVLTVAGRVRTAALRR